MSVPASARTAAAKAPATAGESTAATATSTSAKSTCARDPANTATAEHGKDNDDERDDRHAAAPSRADGGAADIAEHRAQNGSDDRNRHQQDDKQVPVVERMPWRGAPGRFRGQRLAAADDFDNAVDAGVDALAELALLEVRCDGFGDDPSRRHVGQHTLETVTDLDAHVLVVFGDQKDRAVVLALLSDLPRLGN